MPHSALQAAAALLAVPESVRTLGGALAHQLATVRAALRGRDPRLLALAGDGRLPDESAAEALLAREHYFPSWADALAHADRPFDPRFEAAADAIVAGDVATLRRLLAEDPGLVQARSPYGHRATLLNHVGANGIEITRQWQSPPNACEVARVLLEAGAEPDATCLSYGHPDTTLTMVCSSCHPAAAGVQADLVEVLVGGGARVDGPDDDGGPLWTAITWGYGAAAERLAALGARVDNLVFAAALGDLDAVRAFFSASGAADGSLRPGRARSAERIGVHGPALDPGRMLEYATIYAAGLGRRDVVAFLLTKGPDLELAEPAHGGTALGAASHPHPDAGRPDGNPDVVALLTASAP